MYGFDKCQPCDLQSRLQFLKLQNLIGMQANNAAQGRGSNNRKMLFIICVYLFLIMSTRYYPSDIQLKTNFIRQKMSLPDYSLTLSDALSIFSFQQIYQGRWTKPKDKTSPESNYFLTEDQGKFRMYVDRQTAYTSTFFYRAQMQLFNGDFIDKGTILLDIYMENSTFTFEKNDKNQGVVYYNASSQQKLRAMFRAQKILSTEDEGSTNVTQMSFVFTASRQSVNVELNIQTSNIAVTLSALKPEDKAVATTVLAAILLFCSYMSFSSIMTILKDIIQLQDNPRRYSFVTIMLTNMWDTVLCIVCFIFAFKDQQSLMLFIIPAFLLCLLFTNLQPRLMIFIYQNFMDQNMNLRQVLCRFNLYHYGSLFSIYPLLLITNFNWLLFIGMSCIIFPQIYTNAFINIRPNVMSTYYMKYLLTRFILIIYLKAFPYNIFSLQPDYILATLCCTLIALQFGLVWVQQVYGSKKVMPSFLLQPVFDYKLQEEFNIEQTAQMSQCSICLAPLHSEAPKNDDLQFEPSYKLMKTPCNHQYHSHCLMVWMKIKMECPQCRYKLPPYQ